VWSKKSGEENCEHDFEIVERQLHSGTIDLDKTVHWALKAGNLKTDWKTKDGFCNKCGAWKGQLGLEPTFDLYIKHLCDIFEEVKRVLRDDGTCWVNLGDTYYTKSGSGFLNDNLTKNDKMKNQIDLEGSKIDYTDEEKVSNTTGINKANELREGGQLPSKTLTMIPMRFAIEMVNRGWILRNTIIWHKRNCMPSSVKDRFTVDFEYIFFFSKKKNYYFETQYEDYAPASDVRYRQRLRAGKSYDVKEPYKENIPYHSIKRRSDDKDGLCIGGYEEKGRNKRCVWAINPKPFKEAHFAVYPEELCETPIKAGCPEFVCVKCGNAKYPRYKPSKEYERLLKSQRKTEAYSTKRREEAIEIGNAFGSKKISVLPDYKVSFEPTCGCNVGFIGGIVLDPFFGSGTTGLVALKQDKKFIGIELNKEYIEIAKKRLKPFLEQRKL